MRRPSTPRLLAIGLLCGTFATAPPAAAQDHPNFARGLGQPTAYDPAGFDTVNLFNGNLHLAIPIGPRYPLGGGLGYGLTLHYNSGVWDFLVGPVEGGLTTTIANLQPFNEAGLGWLLSLGRLYAPNTPPLNDGSYWMLLEPDGTRRIFHDRLHVSDPLNQAFYTRDGSYLRMKFEANGEKRIESPDGSARIFRSDGKLRQITDTFGNWVNVNYPSSSAWTMTDQHGRTQTVTLHTSGSLAGHVSKVAFDGFGASTYEYTFNYSVVSIPRHRRDTSTSNSATVTAPLLTSISLPDGSSFGFTSYTSLVNVDGNVQPPGTLSGYTLPTLGRYDFVYGVYSFYEEPGDCPGVPCLPQWTQEGDGVRSKKMFDPSGALLGTWHYERLVDATTTRVRTLVKSPQGDDTIHHFRRSPYDWSHGLPYDPSQGDGTGTRFLSTAVYQGVHTSNLRKRRVFVRFTADQPGPTLQANQRLDSTRTVYDDDGGRYAQTDFASFDGLGHYRQVSTSGTFDAGNVASTTTNFNLDRGTYRFDHATNTLAPEHSFTPWPHTSRWVLGTFSDHTAAEGTQQIKTQVCFERDASGPTGFPSRVRRLQGATAGSFDVLSVRTRDAAGNVTFEQLYGGDVQALATTSDPCLVTLPSTDRYRIGHTYQYGVRRFSEAKSATGAGIGLVLLDRDVDPSGMISTTRDGAGIATSYEYDTAGRLAWAKPQAGHGAWTQLTYLGATTLAPYVTITQFHRPNGSKTASPLAESGALIDAFGRPWRERVRMPNGNLTARETLYNAMGWTVSVSGWGPLTKKTTFSLFDPFGRPGRITPADGTAHNVNLTYFGDREISRQSKVWTSTAGETSEFTTLRLDRQGRTYQVTEASGATGGYVTTTYGYDAAGRLSSVSTPSGGTTQNRAFTYDNRGFLLWERHPEKGSSGNGTVTYSSYDPLGLPGRMVDGPTDLLLTRDRAGRLLEVKNNLTNEPLVILAYGTANVTGDWRKGKLVSADRYNYLSVGTTPYLVQLRETYTYGGVGGRPTGLSTFWVNSTTGDLFTQGWTYDDLGNVTRLTYPRCAQSGCGGAAAISRLVDFGYTNGALSSIPGYLNALNYYTNGTVASAVHANGVTWNQASDPNSLPRPASFQATAGMTTLWSTGTYAYDGEGNVRAIGSASFLYDPVSRLKTANVVTDPLGATNPLTQTFTYDGFGNLTSVGGSNGRNIPTTTATNRLATVGVGPTCEVTETYFDSAGNLLCWQGNTFSYDPLGSVTRTVLSGNEYDHAYNAAGERLLTYQPGVGFRWTFRDLGGRVLREIKNGAGTWTVERDYVYRHGTPVASVQPTGEVYHLHPDHLGSPRLVTRNGALQAALHTYFPYGDEATAINQDTERLKFTGHERDLGITWSAADDIDYQHARYYSQLLGRYLSPDPIGGDLGMPQSWNRYGYALSNPMKYVDLWGLDEQGGIISHVEMAPLPSPSLPWWFWFVNRGYGGGGSSGSAGGGGGASIQPNPSPTNPLAPCGTPQAPPGVDIRKNVASVQYDPATRVLIGSHLGAEGMFGSRLGTAFGALGDSLTRWNFKAQGRQYGDFTNFHFGAVASAAGFPEGLVRRAGGIINVFERIDSFAYGRAFRAAQGVFGFGPDAQSYGDEDLNDLQNVMAGYAWEQNCMRGNP